MWQAEKLCHGLSVDPANLVLGCLSLISVPQLRGSFLRPSWIIPHKAQNQDIDHETKFSISDHRYY